MSEYLAPVRDMQFVLNELADLGGVAKLPGFEEITQELVTQILEENAKFPGEVLAPLNSSGDREGSVWENGKVRTVHSCAPRLKGPQLCGGGINRSFPTLPGDPHYDRRSLAGDARQA